MTSQDEKASIEGVPRSTGRHGAVDLVATMQEFSVFPASPVTRELYCSSNGDRWYLCRDADRVFVVHVPNVASGGKFENFAIGEFLAGGKSGPEHQELLRLIGTLVDVLQPTGRSSNNGMPSLALKVEDTLEESEFLASL